MNKFSHTNLSNIKDRFTDETGVELRRTHRILHPMKTILITAVLLTCFLSVTAFADDVFTALDGDDLAFASRYAGDGIVLIEVENRSDKTLRFQKVLKLMQWTTADEILPYSDAIGFDGTIIAPNSTGIMTIDLSRAYDLELLETTLPAGDHYYFVLTNNNFVFGQDWMCSVDFAPDAENDVLAEPSEPVIPETDNTTLAKIEEDLKSYFETITFDIEQRTLLATEYAQNCRALFDELGITVVSPVAPHILVNNDVDVIFDASVPEDEQHLLVGQHYHTADWKVKMLGADFSEKALVLSADLPGTKYEDSGAYLPLLYIFTYDKSQITSEDDSIFVYGQLFKFSEIEDHKVFEDDAYVCYDMTFAVYSDLWEHAEAFVDWRGDVRFDESVQKRVEAIYSYFSEHLDELMHYHPSVAQ